MIKRVDYHKDHLKIYFEWPLTFVMLTRNKKLNELVQTLSDSKKDNLILSGEDIEGVVVDYDSWVHVVERHDKVSSERPMASEMKRFLQQIIEKNIIETNSQ
jgi:hypothetical protein